LPDSEPSRPGVRATTGETAASDTPRAQLLAGFSIDLFAFSVNAAREHETDRD
jgi:hypothetical protein